MSPLIRRLVHVVPFAALAAFLFAAPALAQPTFGKAFAPATIGSGSTSRLTFTITNQTATPVSDLAFTDTPAGMTIADPASASTTCTGALLSAPDGGSTITFSNGGVGAFSSCTVRVNVTATTTGVNTSSPLSSSAGEAAPASATLTVDTGRPGFSKSFAPDSIAFPGRSTLTFTIDNSGSEGSTSFNFQDNLPAGMVIASPSNATINNCTASNFTATPGSAAISVSGGSVSGSTVCTISVDVTTTSRGRFDNVSGELLSGFFSISSGFATDSLSVPFEFLNKSFLDDPVPPGGTVELEFTLQNPDRANPATDIAFDDDLESVVTDLAPNATLPTDPCGAGSTLDFSAGTLSLTGGSLAAAGSCTFSVFLLVPAGTSDGTYGNTTTPVTATIDGSGVEGNSASDTLFVVSAPILTKEFTDDPVGPGGTVKLEFTITNTSTDSSLTSIAFSDELTTFLPTPLSVTLPLNPPPPCGPGSTLTVGASTVGASCTSGECLSLNGGNLAAADSCTFSVEIDIPAGFPGGTYTNVTSEITGLLGGEEPVAGRPATDDLVVVGAPRLSKQFTDDPTAPGDPVTLRFVLTHDAFAPADATGISFSDNLSAALAGLEATSVDVNMCSGANVDISTPSQIVVTGAILAPGASCSIELTLTVPAGANPGRYTNTTSDVTATVAGVETTGNPASDDLRVAGLFLVKEFTNDPAIPGDTVNLRFTLDNTSGVAIATAISFTDNLDATLTGLTAVAPPPTPCGGTLSGASTLSFSGGSVAAGSSCFFDVTLLVPAGADDGNYLNVTSALSATIGGTPLILDPASDRLVVDSELLSIAKSFTNDPTVPGGTVTLELVVTNLDPARAASAVTFSDDLGAALAGLTIGSVISDDCGGVLGGVGTDMLTYTGGSIGGGGFCTVRLQLDVPAGPLSGNAFTNVTSEVTGTIDGFAVSGPPASDVLRVFTLSLTKSFGDFAQPGGTVVLTFTIENLDSSSSATLLSFSDSLPAGLSAIGLPTTDVCGAGSSLSGATFLTLSGASLGPSSFCTFDVTLQVPAGATPGVYTNTTSSLQSSGLPVGGPASAELRILGEVVTFTKSFDSNPVLRGGLVDLRFRILNLSADVTLTDITFTDDLSDVVTGLAAIDTPKSDVCGAGSLISGTTSLTLTGGNLPPLGSCDIVVKLRVPANAPLGAHENTTGPLTAETKSAPMSMAAATAAGARGMRRITAPVLRRVTDELTVQAPPATATLIVTFLEIDKSFNPMTVAPGGTTKLTFTLENPDPVNGATNVTFSDDLGAFVPGAMAVGLPKSDVCGAGSQLSGSSVVTLTGGSLGPGGSCTFAVDVSIPPATPENVYTNTTTSVQATVAGVTAVGDPADAATATLTVSSLVEIPTLGGVGLALLAGLLLLVAGARLRRLGTNA